MNKFPSLLKVSLIENFKLNKLFKNSSVATKIVIGVLALFVFAILGFNFGLIYYNMSLLASDPNEIMPMILKTALSFASILIIITTLTQSYGYLFKGNDFDLLVSMPIKLKHIVLSKVVTLLISNYAVLIIAYLPAIFVIALLGLAPKFIFYFNSLLVFFLFPLAILSIFAFLSYLIARIFRNFRFKNLIIIVGSVVLLIAYLGFSFNMGENQSLFISVGNVINYIYYPASFAVNALLGNFNYLVIFILFNIILFIIFINVMGSVYLKINTSTKAKQRVNKKNVEVIRKGQTKTLIKTEFKKYFSFPQYVINTIFGKIVLPIGMIMLAIQISGSNLDQQLPFDLKEIAYLLIGLVAVFAITITSTTTVSISIEGKQLWILKSSPITTKQILISKMIVDLTTTYLPAIIGIVGIAIILPFDILGLTLITLLIVVLGIHNATLGIILNLKFPKLKWDLPVRVVKQSLSVLLHTFISFGLITVSLVGGIILFSVIGNAYLVFIIILGLFILLTVGEILLLNKYGNKWFSDL